jgi:N-glycosylase/DNA lyase
LEGAIRKSLERRGEGLSVRLRALRGRILEVDLSLDPRHKFEVLAILEDLASGLEGATGIPYAIWDLGGAPGSGSSFRAKLVRLDFLDGLRRAMGEVGNSVRGRMAEFERAGMDEDGLFEELCFCILTANFSAEGGIRIQEAIGDGFLKLSERELSKRLEELGHRYPRARAKYIVEARWVHGGLAKRLRGFRDAKEAREWLVENVKGLGYKEASHFLRNVGFGDVAIIDRHVLRFLREMGLIEEMPRALGKGRYLELERLLSAVASKLGLSVGELDLYIWYEMTGKVLK